MRLCARAEPLMIEASSRPGSNLRNNQFINEANQNLSMSANRKLGRGPIPSDSQVHCFNRKTAPALVGSIRSVCQPFVAGGATATKVQWSAPYWVLDSRWNSGA